MPLVNMKKLLSHGKAVGAFSVANLEMVQGAVHAAEKEQTPIILQVAEGRLATSPLFLIAPCMLAAARNAKVDIAVHLDHGTSMSVIAQALELGFTSVMFDGSRLSMYDNVKWTRAVMTMARAYGASVEGEIGCVGRTEEGREAPAQFADPAECQQFVEETNVDALAVAIGNIHGVYAGTPLLQFDILEQVHKRISTPLVLHGGTGISQTAFSRCIALGMRKINIATACFQAAAMAAHRGREDDIFDVSRQMIDAVEAVVRDHIQIFRGESV